MLLLITCDLANASGKSGRECTRLCTADKNADADRQPGASGSGDCALGPDCETARSRGLEGGEGTGPSGSKDERQGQKPSWRSCGAGDARRRQGMAPGDRVSGSCRANGHEPWHGTGLWRRGGRRGREEEGVPALCAGDCCSDPLFWGLRMFLRFALLKFAKLTLGPIDHHVCRPRTGQTPRLSLPQMDCT